MNERIEQLAVEARQYAFGEVENSQDPTEWSTKYYNEMFEQKFAELIVRECINQVKEQYLPVMEDVAMMNDEHWKGYKHCGVDSVVAIKEHFGVEE
jgi:hypothetical protein